jgi:hypothetical protein
MPKALDEMMKEVMERPPRERLALAGFLLENTEPELDAEAPAAWDSEIRDRIGAIEDGRVTGLSFEEVVRSAERRLAR